MKDKNPSCAAVQRAAEEGWDAPERAQRWQVSPHQPPLHDADPERGRAPLLQPGRLGREVERVQTTCISTTPEQKSHRSTGLKLTLRETMPDGRFKLVYGGPFQKHTHAERIQCWIERMRNVEKQTGKTMGISLTPQALAPAIAA